MRVRALAALLAACCAGFGGLLIEIVALRRTGLAIGNTAGASGLVLAVFLAGLGLGGLLVGSPLAARFRHGGMRSAAWVYAAVAVLVFAGDRAFAALGVLESAPAAALAILAHPGGAAVAMGVAFPLLFGPSRVPPGMLIGANLFGSVAACAVGGTWLIPELGFGVAAAIASASYGLAALAAAIAAAGSGPMAVALTSGDARRPRVALPLLLAAAASGLGTVGFEVLLLRRMPFFLDGFQPTLAGTLAVCLLWLAVGAAVGPPLLKRGIGAPRALGVAVILAGVSCCWGLHEWIGPSAAQWPVDSDLGLHGRVWLAVAVAAAPACLFLGAIPPLCIERACGPDALDDGASQRVAGRVFCAQGVGSLLGALLASVVVPAVAPRAYFVMLPVAVGLCVVAGAPASLRARALGALGVMLLAALGVAGPGRPWSPRPPVQGSRYDRQGRYRHLDHRTDQVVTASVVYDSQEHRQILFTDEFRAAYTGPDTAYMKVLGHLPFLLRPGALRDVAVIALGTGTTADAVSAWPDPRVIHVVEIAPAVLELVDRFAGDGPVPTGQPPRFLADARTSVHLTDGRRWLALQPAASLDLVTMEPLLPYASGTAALYSAEFYALAKSRLREDGLLVQWVPTHAMPAAFYATLLATFGRAFEHSSAWLVDQSTLLVGSRTAHLPDAASMAASFARLPARAAATLHEAAIAAPVDLDVAFVGSSVATPFADAATLHDDRPFLERIGYWSGERRLAFYPGNVEQLASLIGEESAVWTVTGTGEDAVAVRRERLRAVAVRARAEARLVGARAAGENDPTLAVLALSRARATRPTSALLHREETLAWRVRRAPTLFGRDGSDAATVRATRQRQARRDPGLGLLLDADAAAPLGQISSLPAEPEALVALASAPHAFGAAVRMAYPVRVARAIVALARERDVPIDAELAALFDPASLDGFARACLGRDPQRGLTAVARAWRSDLPMPAALEQIVTAVDPARRRRVAAVLAGHRGARARAALATLLVDPDVAVREAAGAALFHSLRDAVAYDPHWPEERLEAAARVVRGGARPSRDQKR